MYMYLYNAPKQVHNYDGKIIFIHILFSLFVDKMKI